MVESFTIKPSSVATMSSVVSSVTSLRLFRSLVNFCRDAASRSDASESGPVLVCDSLLASFASSSTNCRYCSRLSYRKRTEAANSFLACCCTTSMLSDAPHSPKMTRYRTDFNCICRAIRILNGASSTVWFRRSVRGDMLWHHVIWTSQTTDNTDMSCPPNDMNSFLDELYILRGPSPWIRQRFVSLS